MEVDEHKQWSEKLKVNIIIKTSIKRCIFRDILSIVHKTSDSFSDGSRSVSSSVSIRSTISFVTSSISITETWSDTLQIDGRSKVYNACCEEPVTAALMV